MSRNIARRILAASALVLGASASFSPAVMAAENGAAQQGEMPVVETVGYTPAAKFNFTPGTAMTSQSFGTVNVRSNANGGWLLEVKTLEQEKLAHSTLAGVSIAYSLKVDGVDIATTAANTYAQAKDTSTLTCAAVGGCDYNVTADIAVVDSNGKPAGTYQDTITFKLTNK